MTEIEDMKHLSTHRLIQNKKGFTLIELAMVMIIVGLLLTIGMSMLGPLTKRAKLAEARETVKAAREAVVGWTVKNGYLPADIGSTGGKNVDSWGKEIAFVRALEIDTSTENACRTIGTNNRTTLNICLNGDCASQLVRNIAFVVASGGDNFNIQTWTIPGGTGNCPASEFCVPIYTMDTTVVDVCTDLANCPTAATAANDPDRNEGYDDIVQYVSLDEIRTALNCPQPLVVTSPSRFPTGEEDSFYSYSMQAIGGKPPYGWGDGPPLWSGSGLSLNSSGLISGTLNFNNAGDPGELATCREVITIGPTRLQVTDSSGSVAFPPPPFANYSIPVRPKPLAITNTDLPSTTVGTVNAAYATLSGTGGVRSGYSWTLTGVPAWLSGVLDGLTGDFNLSVNNPPTPGTFSFTATLTDGCGGSTASKRFSITVNPREGYYCTINATPATLNSGNFTNINYAVYNYQTSPPNVTLAFSSSPAALTGTCTGGSVVANTSPYVGSCQSAALPSSTSFTLMFTDAAGKQTSCSTTAFVGPQTTVVPSCTLTASPNPVSPGTTSTLIWTIQNGPADISFAPSNGTCTSFSGSFGGNCTTAAISSNTTYTATASNSNGNGLCATTVYAGSAGVCTVPSITTTSLPNGRNGLFYSTTLAASSGTPPYTWSWSGGPSTPTLNASTGVISGTPAVANIGLYSPTITITDSCPYGPQSTSRNYSMAIGRVDTYTVRNFTGSNNVWVRGGQYAACTRINNNATFNVRRVDTTQVNIYTNNTCTTSASLSAVAYGNPNSVILVDEAGDRDGRLRINAAWSLIDE